MSSSHIAGVFAAPHRTSELLFLVPRGHHGAPLTAREQEVAILIAYGFTNRQIAAQLVIALRTADNHVQHIFDKLGLTSRSQVAAWVALEGMLDPPSARTAAIA
jgi:DNA-binding NarL/FixJ family response regulator